MLSLILACVLAFACSWLSSVGGVGGGLLMTMVLAAIFGLDLAVPMLALTQVVGNGGRALLNWRDVDWGLVRWYALGAIPFALTGGILLAYAPVDLLKRLLGGFLVAAFVWRRVRPTPAKPSEKAFAAVGGATGFGSALIGAAGPLAAPFFLAYGLLGNAYIGTEAAASLVIHLTKLVAYGATDLLSLRVFQIAAMMTPAVIAGAWLGRMTIQRVSAAVFVRIVEAGLLAGGVVLMVGK